jgi:hypothetical protein
MTEPKTGDAFARALHEELERRIAELATYEEKAFGTPISTGEVIAALIAFALIPILVVWACA